MRSVTSRGLIVLVACLALPNVALATDNDTNSHRHTREWGFRLNSSLPADWKGAITEAALAWTENTRLNFTRNTPDTSSTDPSTTSHIV